MYENNCLCISLLNQILYAKSYMLLKNYAYESLIYVYHITYTYILYIINYIHTSV